MKSLSIVIALILTLGFVAEATAGSSTSKKERWVDICAYC